MELKLPKIDIGILRQKKKPLHVAINGSNITGWAEKNKKEEKEAVTRHIAQIMTFVRYQLKQTVPILTLNISAETDEEVAALVDMMNELIKDEEIHKNKVRVFVIGNWYDLETELTDCFKKIMDETKDYDNLFLNLCVKYDGQEEVLGVIKLLSTKARLGKLELEDLNVDMVKENLYTSYFTPPEVIIEPNTKYSGLLLWDSKGSKIFQTRTHWLDLTPSMVEEAIKWANRE